jgi:hypothetical protein
LGTFLGLHFIQVNKNRAWSEGLPHYEVNLLREVYFKGSSIASFLEYEPGLYAVCLAQDSAVNLLNRFDGSIQRVIKPCGKSVCYELCMIPGFSLKQLPYLLLRDDLKLYLVCVSEKNLKVTPLAPARYLSKQNYRTMEVVVAESLYGGPNEFSVVLLTHMNDQTSRLLTYKFDQKFIETILL